MLTCLFKFINQVSLLLIKMWLILYLLVYLLQMIFTDHINRRLYVTQNEGESFVGKTILDSPDLLVFHPTKEKWVLRYSDQSNTVKIYYR